MILDVDINLDLGLGGLLVGVVGVILTIYYSRKADEINLKRKRLEWPDIQAASTDLARRIKKDFIPSAIVTPGLTGATFANLLIEQFPNQPPVFVGTRTWKDEPHGDIPREDSFTIETKKWYVTIPASIAKYVDGPILIVDDFAMSGDFMDMLRQKLVETGISKESIRSATIAVTKVAIRNHKGPDYYWWVADDDDFFFPWGKAR